MRKTMVMAVMVGMAGVWLAQTAFARMDFDTPEMTYQTWLIRLSQYEGKHEYSKPCYSESLRDEINERTKSPEGVRKMDAHHMYLNREIGKYEASEPRQVSDTEAVITLTEKGGKGKAEIRFILEDNGWMIDNFPDIGSEAGLSGRMLFILGIVLLVIILVLGKKVLLP